MMNEELQISRARKRRFVWIGIGLLILLAAGYGIWQVFYKSAVPPHTVVQTDDYTCPMHQQVHSDKPGDCPICGMKLVKRSTLRGTASTDTMGGGTGLAISALSAVRANVATMKVERRTLQNQMRLPGAIEIAEPNEHIITARVRGRIEKLYVKETGTYIKAGSPLYELYSPELSNDAAQYLILKNNPDHASTIHSNASAHSIDLESAARQKLKLYSLTDTQIDDLEKNDRVPQTFTIYAPVSGTVLKKSVLDGSWVDEGTVLFQVAELSTVWASIDIPQEALSLIRIGQQVVATTSTYPSTTFSGPIIFISPVLNETTRTARIRVALENLAGKLKIQMSIDGSIVLQSDRTLAVPASAIVHNGAENLVWVKRSDGMFYPQKVTIGFRDADDFYAVSSGIAEGDEIAVSGTFLIDSERELKMGSTPMPGMDMPQK
ncbi:MAG TPA: efflux RND transporter periplasmic adaptor subunit [Candidatus Kapabacteria bacterium]|nr:efflux RND transporter periplasmic adaptor subunit [Candidatus Kapabacteria bacterium]